MVLNYDFVGVAVYALFYIALERKTGSLAALLVLCCWVGANAFAQHVPYTLGWKIVAVSQVVCWSFQFTAHGVLEGRAPALLDNLAQAFLRAPYFVLLEPRGIDLNGIDFLSTGEVKKINVSRIKERLDSSFIVILSNLGYSLWRGPQFTYEVATACATALQADKLLFLLDGLVRDEIGRLVRLMTLQEADHLIRKRARQSYSAADYVKAVAGAGYV